MPEFDGYSAEDAIVDVLVDAGILADERLVEEEELTLDPAMLNGYSIELTVP